MNCPDTEAGGTRLDRFHRGRFTLCQPIAGGFRAGLDAMLLAATVHEDASDVAADIGAGTGAVGFGAAARAPGLTVTLVERRVQTAALLRASLALGENEALAPRLRVVEADILQTRLGREAAGLRDGSFSLVLSNPPFYPADHRPSGDVARREALSAAGGDFLSRWVRACAALLENRGRLALVVRPEDLVAVTQALEGRMGGIAVVPVHTRPGPARRILVGATKGSRAGLSILPAVALVSDGGQGDALSTAIADGRHHIPLFGDAA